MRLRRSARAAWLAAHVLGASAWFGVLLVLACARGSPRHLSTPLIIVLAAAPLCVATGLVLSLGTPWGLLRYRWLQAKWVLVILVVGLAAYTGTSIRNPQWWRVAGAAALATTVVLSIFRPGGQRKQTPRARHRAARLRRK